MCVFTANQALIEYHHAQQAPAPSGPEVKVLIKGVPILYRDVHHVHLDSTEGTPPHHPPKALG